MKIGSLVKTDIPRWGTDVYDSELFRVKVEYLGKDDIAIVLDIDSKEHIVKILFGDVVGYTPFFHLQEI